MFCRPIIICLLVTHTVFALKCHVCNNMDHGGCFKITKPDDARFLKDCPSDSTRCGLKSTYGDIPQTVRQCVSKEWECKSDCYSCGSDGCNYNTEIKQSVEIPGVEITAKDLIEANLYPICGVLLVAGLLLVWCITSCCSRDNSDYDDEEFDEEYDFEYEESNEVVIKPATKQTV